MKIIKAGFNTNIEMNTSLEKMRKEELLNGKRIAIVGNCRHLLDEKLGKKIDSYDIVIRMNNFITKGYSQHTGSKFNGYAAASKPLLRNTKRLEHVPFIMCSSDREAKITKNRLGSLKKEILEKTVTISQSYNSQIFKECENNTPSTGLICVLWILDNIDFKDLFVCGLSFDNTGNHYFNQNSTMDRCHSFKSEAVVLRNHLPNNVDNIDVDKVFRNKILKRNLVLDHHVREVDSKHDYYYLESTLHLGDIFGLIHLFSKNNVEKVYCHKKLKKKLDTLCDLIDLETKTDFEIGNSENKEVLQGNKVGLLNNAINIPSMCKNLEYLPTKLTWSKDNYIKKKVCYNFDAASLQKYKLPKRPDLILKYLEDEYDEVVNISYPMSFEDAVKHLAESESFFTVDTGLAHIARSVGTPIQFLYRLTRAVKTIKSWYPKTIWKNRINSEIDIIRRNNPKNELIQKACNSIEFIHVPKTAGQSVKTALSKVQYILNATGKGHYSIKESPKEDHRFYLAFTRNPYDRLISAYSYLKKGGMDKDNRRIGNLITRLYPTFKDFCLQFHNHEEIANYTHIKPQMFWLEDLNGELPYDFLGKFETLYQDWSELCQLLDIRNNLPNKNKSKHDRWYDIYDDEMREAVYEFYKEDFIKLQYEK